MKGIAGWPASIKKGNDMDSASVITWIFLLSPVLALAVNAAAQVIFQRVFHKKNILPSILCGLCCGALFYFILWRSEIGPIAIFPDMAVAGLFSYLLLSYGYFSFVNLAAGTSLRIRLIAEIDAPFGLEKTQLLRRYNDGIVYSARIRRLVASDQVIEKDGKFILRKTPLLILAAVLDFTRKVVLG